MVEPGRIGRDHRALGKRQDDAAPSMIGLPEPNRGEVLVNGREVKTIASADYARR